MGLSDAAGFFPCDPKDLTRTELGFLREPTLGFSDRRIHASPRDRGSKVSSPKDQEVQDQDFGDKQGQEQERESNIRSFCEDRENVRDDDDEEDGCKTPTRSDQMIPAMPRRCPAAPRKVPARRMKKMNPCRSRKRMFVDVPREIEALFPPAFLDDLSNNIKKARYC